MGNSPAALALPAAYCGDQAGALGWGVPAGRQATEKGTSMDTPSARTDPDRPARRRLLAAAVPVLALALGVLTAPGPAAAGTQIAGAFDLTDTDSDGLLDADETSFYGTNPYDYDTDDDGRSDGDEILYFGTDPFSAPPLGEQPDTDGDGLVDQDEAYIYNTNPLDYDSDDDGTNDGLEIFAGTDPWHAPAPDSVGPSPILLVDTDRDGLYDSDETGFYGTDPYAGDTDRDDLVDGEEVAEGTNPLVYDTDGDGNRDGCDTDPLVPSEPVGCISQG